MRNLKITLAYDGTDFCGWQVQPERPTIQGSLESVLQEIEGAPVKVHGSGRTDAGVHALAQVASFHLHNPIPVDNLRKAMNRLLPETIRVTAVEDAAISFHARHSARAKTYEYRMWRGDVCPPFLGRYAYAIPFRLDERAMIEAAGHFQGTHDFCSLAARAEQEKPSTVRTIFSSRLERSGDSLIYRVRGSGFLYHMVRNIVGTLLDVGRGNLAPADVERILASKNRSEAGPTAPARGLFLVGVEYENVDHEGPGAPLPVQCF